MNKHISILVTLVLGFSCTGKKQASPEVDQQEMKLLVGICVKSLRSYSVLV